MAPKTQTKEEAIKADQLKARVVKMIIADDANELETLIELKVIRAPASRRKSCARNDRRAFASFGPLCRVAEVTELSFTQEYEFFASFLRRAYQKQIARLM